MSPSFNNISICLLAIDIAGCCLSLYIILQPWIYEEAEDLKEKGLGDRFFLFKGQRFQNMPDELA